MKSPGVSYQYPPQEIQDHARRKGARDHVRRGILTHQGGMICPKKDIISKSMTVEKQQEPMEDFNCKNWLTAFWPFHRNLLDRSKLWRNYKLNKEKMNERRSSSVIHLSSLESIFSSEIGAQVDIKSHMSLKNWTWLDRFFLNYKSDQENVWDIVKTQERSTWQ